MKPATLDDLAEALRQGRSPSPDEWARAREYERSLLPADAAWPVEGEVYACPEDTLLKFVTHWHTAFTGGGEGRLLRGETIRIGSVGEPRPIFVPARPVDYATVEQRVVPAADRLHPRYAGFTFSMRTRELLSHFRRLS